MRPAGSDWVGVAVRGSERGGAVLSLAVALVAASPEARAQEIPRDAYIRHLPQTPAIVGQARASAKLYLYGDLADPEYTDRSPVDGIDDRRAARLLTIAERFAPVMRRNRFLVPRDVWWVAGDRPWMQVDSWVDERLVHSDSIRFDAGTRVDDGRPVSPPISMGDEAASDARLVTLIRELDPERMLPAATTPGAHPLKTLFIDTPGDGEQAWRASYEKRGSAGARAYAHFFIDVDPAGVEEPGYTLVVQYLFFYPFNDGGNNHEGDWEHINVLISTRDAVSDSTVAATGAGYVTRSSIARILDGRTPLDSLVIGAVDYFFHNHMIRLDYRAAVAPHDDRSREPIPQSVTPLWEDHRYSHDIVDARVHAHGGALATHPIAYIGGNNKGPDELFHLWPRFLRSFNRSSGATYPFPGTWQTIGPLGTTETIWGDILPTVAGGSGAGAYTGILARDLTGDHWLTFTSDDIDLLPDWERLLPLIRADSDIRRRWAWLILPVRWGYPAMRSPGGGAVAHTDLGNLAPFGPAFKPWWNRAGPDAEHESFPLRVLRTPMSPRVPWSAMQSGWGVLNYPIILSQVYPFYNVVGAHLSPWTLPAAGQIGVHFPKTFVAATELERIATIGVGVTRSFGGDGYARTLLRVDAASALVADGAVMVHERMTIIPTTSPRIMLDLHIGRSVFMENSFSMGDAAVRYSARPASTAPEVALDGTLEMRQVTGGFRAPFPWAFTPNSRTFARLGYAWTWYTLHEVRLDGAPVDASLRGGYHPSLLPTPRSWPNMAYTGIAYEYFGPRSSWLLNGVGYGFRIDGSLSLQRLPGHERRMVHDLWMRRGDLSVTATIGW